jgi:hypothetical protein
MAEHSATINLKTAESGDLTRPMKDLLRATKEVTKAEEAYQRLLKQRAGAFGGPQQDPLISRVGGAGGEGGGLGGMLGGMGRLAGPAAAYAAVTMALGRSARAIETVNDGFLSVAQKNEALAKQIPGGESLIAFVNAVSGVTNALQKLEVALGRSQLSLTNDLERQLLRERGRSEVGAASLRAQARGSLGFPGLPDIDRSTFQGDIRYQEESARLGHRFAVNRAEEERRAAERTYLQSGAAIETLRQRQVRLRRGLFQARTAQEQAFVNSNVFGITAATSRVEQTQAANRVSDAQKELANNQIRLEAEINRHKAYGLSLSEKESALRKAQNAALREELNILRNREQRLSGAAVGIGSMNAMQRAMGLNAARLIKQGGIGAVPPELQAMAASFAPDFVRKEREKFGQQTAEFKAAQREGLIQEGNLADIRKEIAKVQTQVEINVVLDEVALAEKIANVLARSFQDLLRNIEAKFAARQSQFESGIRLKNAQR